MNANEFRHYGKEMVDFIADYWTHLRHRSPVPSILPGYINALVPSRAPAVPEEWSTIFRDLDTVVMKGNSNWHHPHFFAYFPSGCSYQAIMADMLSGAVASIGFSWVSGPAMTELEMISLDWLVDVLGLPLYFKNSAPGPGCGIIQSTASDSTLVAIMTARGRIAEMIKGSINCETIATTPQLQKVLQDMREEVKKNAIEDEKYGITAPEFHDPVIIQKLIAYSSEEAHSSIEKGAMLSGVRLRKLKTIKDALGNYTVCPKALEESIQIDRKRGFIPFILIANIGTTSSCGMDHLDVIGPICQKEGIWLHVDAAYAGSFFMCEEFRYLSKGIEYVDSFNFNAHKAMFVNFDCSPMWFKDSTKTARYFNVDPLYLKHEHATKIGDYRHLQIALGRRFRSLKIWFVLRNLGVPKMQEILRKQNSLARQFAVLVENSLYFRLFVPQHLGVVCFRVREESNELTEALYKEISNDKRIYLVPAKIKGHFFLRFVICSQLTTNDDVIFAFNVISELYNRMMKHWNSDNSESARSPAAVSPSGGQDLPQEKTTPNSMEDCNNNKKI